MSFIKNIILLLIIKCVNSQLIEVASFFGVGVMVFNTVHECPQGHKCVYKTGGKVSHNTANPGFNVKMPISSVIPVQTTWQTDTVQNIECVSKRGGRAWMDIDVVNKLDNSDNCVIGVVKNYTENYDKQLIFDYVPTEVSQFCKDYTLDEIKTGKYDELDDVLLNKLRNSIKSYGLEECIEIKAVRIMSPRLTSEMQKKFDQLEAEAKELEIKKAQKLTEKTEEERKTQKAVMEEERKQETAKIQKETEKAEAIANAEIQSIEDQKKYDSKVKEAEAIKQSKLLEAEGDEKLLTPEKLKLEAYKSGHNNAKIIIGAENLPGNAFYDSKLFVQ